MSSYKIIIDFINSSIFQNVIPLYATAFFTLGLLVVGGYQFLKFNNQVRADFLYKIMQDMQQWLNSHKETKEWIFEGLQKEPITEKRYEEWEFDDLLGFFETIWSLDKRGLIDEELAYDFFSDYLICIYEANDFEIKKLLMRFRKEEGSDLYVGIDSLYKKMKKRQKKENKKYEKIHNKEVKIMAKTSKKVASEASKLLKKKEPRKVQKSVAGAALRERQSTKGKRRKR